MKRLQWNLYPDIPKVEFLFYLVLWVGCYVLGVIPVYFLSKSKEYIHKAQVQGCIEERLDYLTQSRSLKDITDLEWDLWDRWLWKTIMYPIVYHFVMMRICEKLNAQYRFHASSIFSCGFCIYFFGIKGLVFLLFQSLLCFSVAFLTKNSTCVWGVYLIALVYSSSTSLIEYFESLFKDDSLLMMFISMVSMCSLRHLAFSLEYCWTFNERVLQSSIKHTNKEKSDTSKADAVISEVIQEENLPKALVDLFLYEFYFPLLVNGPVMNYDDFANQIYTKLPVRWTLRYIFRYLLGIVRYIFWHLFANCLLHHFYFTSLHDDGDFMYRLPLLTLCGLGMCLGVFFCLKYIILYGLASTVALADNLDAPGACHCIMGKHKFTQMWRCFDKGLHGWLVRYVFLPLNGLRRTRGLWGTIAASLFVFGFVYLWHGFEKEQLVWAGLNWFGVTLEKLASEAYKSQTVQHYENEYLSPGGSRRLRAILSAPLFGLLIISNFYFIIGIEAANVYLVRIYTEDVFATIFMHFVLYVGVQTSMEFAKMGI